MYKFNVFFIAIVTASFLFSCSSEQEKSSANLASHAKADEATQLASSNQKFEIVPNEMVCMVNNRFMGIKQIPIEVEGITYYGCCPECVKKIQENLGGVRYAKDPVSGKKVDKARAVIIKNNENGMVQYFESEASANRFLKR
ncbi:MAG: hypothetical protein Kow0027_01730 [Saprospiraceae bacterium]